MEDFTLISKYESMNTTKIQLVFMPMGSSDLAPMPGMLPGSSITLHMSEADAAQYVVGGVYALTLTRQDSQPSA